MTQTQIDTKTKILDAAEKLMADNGFHATSIRDITNAADVHVGSINYHFSSKLKLFVAIFERRISVLNEERLRRLKGLESLADTKALSIEDVLEAFFAPVFMFDEQDNCQNFVRLFGRLYVEPGDHWKEVFEMFAEVLQRFCGAIQKILPSLTEEELLWRFHFMIGTMCQTLMDAERIEFMSQGRYNSSNSQAVMKRLIDFTAAGFKQGCVS